MKITLPITLDQVMNARPSKEAWPKDVYVAYTEDDQMEIQANRRISGREIDALLWNFQLALVREKKQELLAKLNGATEIALSKGFMSTALGTPHVYDLRMEDQINLAGLVIAQIDSCFRCQGVQEAHKSYKPHTQAQLKKVFADGLAYKARVLNFFGKEKERLHACESLQAVQEFKIKELEDSNA
ncbi:hypothetical protein NHP200010_15610 [Helicobacter bizzozeronii]|uniref:hypothetical protein n=1 Tax=Helicobacter bizzozeronii TaxID=56877 RepID=UPI00244D862C|nr:hypothetical protein [Helicobacter bizzozeronii]GMB93828.1 hypothetical protein NHP200010_15610 [Helicobacter bizzozeronii]